MTRDELWTVLVEEVARLAPEVAAGSLSRDTRIRDDLDIDSFDFVRLIGRLEERLGVKVPETDYRKLQSLGEGADYLSGRLPARP